MKYLDFEKEEKGYEPFSLSRENIKANIGRQIVYVDKAWVDRYRGYYKVETGIIQRVYYNRLYLEDVENYIDIRDVLECGIKKQQ